jgi:hypothetical protein
MDGTDLSYILLLAVIPVVLALLVALPFIAPALAPGPDRDSNRRTAQPGRMAARAYPDSLSRLPGC